jgi:peptidoglycan/xylan/chitin deacetylase (PgdA/CDA1 family)
MKKKVILLSISIILASIAIYLAYNLFTLPIIKVRNKNTYYNYMDIYNEDGADAYLLFKKLDVDVIIEGFVDTSKLGTYTIKYSIDYNGRKVVKHKNIKVIDNEAPEIILEGGDTYYLCLNKEYEEVGYKANDNYDGDLTDKVEVKIDGKKVYYTVSDSSNNKTTKVRIIKTGDNTPPDIKITGGDSEVVYINKPYKEKGAVAIDNCDGDITSQLEIKNDINIHEKGSYFVTYRVTDSSGNMTEKSKSVVVRKPQVNEPNMIYLTFDDGPSDLTNDILDILKKHNVKATFFVVGSGDDNVIKRAYDEGHAIGVHTYTHQYHNIYSSEESFIQDFDRVKNRIYNITGEETYISRFPGGSSNTVSRFNPGIMTRLAKEVHNRGFEYFDWNINSQDASGKNLSSAIIAQNVIKGLRKDRSNVVLMHDTKFRTVGALEKIILYGKEKGYVFASLTYDSYPAHHNILN